MDNLGITNYGMLNRAYSSPLASSANNSKSTTPNGSSLDMNDFLELLATQFENQDVTNPTDNTEFISELAQFSSLQAMSELTQYSERQYASSLVGKTVEVGTRDETGASTTKTGVVKSTLFASDGCSIIMSVGGKDTAYDVSAVTQVFQDGASGDSKDSGGSGTGGTST